jgi:hypothetical protein
VAGELSHSHGAREIAKGGFEIGGGGLGAIEILRGVPEICLKSHFETAAYNLGPRLGLMEVAPDGFGGFAWDDGG